MANTFDTIMVKCTEMLRRVDEVLKDNNMLAHVTVIEDAIGIKVKYIAIVALSLLLIATATEYAVSLIGNLLCIVYPIYRSTNAIENDDQNQLQQWMMYWTIYASVTWCEATFASVVYFIPSYYLLRTCTLIWCIAPISANGSRIIYGKLISPTIRKHKDSMDKMMSTFTRKVSNVGGAIITPDITDSEKDD